MGTVTVQEVTMNAYEVDYAIIERLEAECGCELAELSDPSLAERAQRLLDCDDPPRGQDRRDAARIADRSVRSNNA